MADYQRIKVSSAPSDPVWGAIYIDETNGLGWYNGSEWVYPGSGGGGGSGTVTSVTAADDSIVVSGTDTVDPEIATATLDVIASTHPPASSWSNNSKKITGLENGSASSDAAAFGQIPTEVEQLTLAGKDVYGGTAPAAGDVLEYNGTEWVSEALPTALPPNGSASGDLSGSYPGPTVAKIQGNAVSSSSPLSNGAQPLVWNGSAWAPVYPSDSALQPGFVGYVNGGVLSAAIASGGGLTFTNWPANDWVYTVATYLNTGLIRGLVPSAPSLTVSGVTSGDYAYVAVYLTSDTPGGTATASVSVGTSRSTAALAAADQATSTINAYGSGETIVIWDGVVYNNSGTYSLVAGTPASGATIPATTGRDRRLWARGFNAIVAGSVSDTTTNQTAPGDAMTSMYFRAECSGNPCHFELTLRPAGPNGYYIVPALLVDGTGAGEDQTGNLWAVAVGSNNSGVTLGFEYTPAVGSHFFALYWWVTGGTGSLDPYSIPKFSMRELKVPSSTNGSA